jgi:tryptophan synthase alpha chain
VVDLPPEEAGPLNAEAEPAGLDVIHLAAPTSTAERLRLIARHSRGFIYLVSLTGVTGERAELPKELAAQIRALRLVTTKPVCVGFGVGRPEQVAAVGQLADGVAVGSAIVRLIEQRAGSPSLVPDVGEFIASLKAPLTKKGAKGA